MSRKKTLPKTFFLPYSLSFLSLLSCYWSTGRNLFLFATAVGMLALSLVPFSGLFFGEGKAKNVPWHSMLRTIIFVSIVACITANIMKVSPLRMGLEKEEVSRVEGLMLQDSSFSTAGNFLVKVDVKKCSSRHGYTTTASGIMTAVGKQEAIVSYGTKVRLTGKFSGDLFIIDELRVLERSIVNDIRESLIERLEARLFGNISNSGNISNCGNTSNKGVSNNTNKEPSKDMVLCSALLLGRSEDNEFSLKELAQKSGCSHVLALSGMHLSVLANICTYGCLIFGSSSLAKLAKLFSFIFIGAFVFVAGPRASLIRAAIMYSMKLFSSNGKPILTSRQRVCYAFLLQSLFFPLSMVDLGSCYGYAAVFAIIFIHDFTYAPICVFVGKRVFSVFWLSVIVLLSCAPIQIISNGSWNPISIVVSPFVSFLAGAEMFTGLIVLALGKFSFLMKISSYIYLLMESLLEKASVFPTAKWGGYLIMLGIIILLELLAIYGSHLIAKKKCCPAFDVEAMRRGVLELA